MSGEKNGVPSLDRGESITDGTCCSKDVTWYKASWVRGNLVYRVCSNDVGREHLYIALTMRQDTRYFRFQNQRERSDVMMSGEMSDRGMELWGNELRGDA